MAGPESPAAAYFYSRNRASEHPRRHLSAYGGILQADAYTEINDLCDPRRKPPPVIEAACWAHARRKFFVLSDVPKAPLAVGAVHRIDTILDVEREINGLPTEHRLAVREQRSRLCPLAWCSCG